MEIGFNPPSLSLNYLPFSGIVPNETVIVVPELPPASAPEIQSKPDWIDVIYDGVELDEDDEFVGFRLILSINTTVANNLAIGYHAGTLRTKIRGPLGFYQRYSLPITLRVLQYIPLTISPSVFNYTHILGDPNPPARYCQIATSGSWSITPDQTWLTFSQYNGTGNATVALFVDTSSLPIGQSSAQFLVDDGRTQKFGKVFVSVSGTSTDDYTVINPIALEFSETYGVAPADIRSFTIDSSLASTIAVDVPWINLSTASAPIGLTTITANTQATEAIAVGAYPGKITVTTTEGEFFVDLLLIIVAKQFPDVKTHGFYYADDRNRITLTSSAVFQELLLNIKAQGPGFGLKNYLRKVPYFRNIISTVVGLETAILLQKAIIPPLATLFYKAISPVRYDFRLSNRSLSGGTPFNDPILIENTHFINGTTPPSVSTLIAGDILTYIPKKITVPSNAFLAFSIRTKASVATCRIDKFQDSLGVNPPVFLPVSVPDTDIYTGIISVEQLNLAPGDRAIITFSLLSFEIVIKPTQLPTAQIIWENEWDLPEIFNCTGPIVLTTNEDTETVVNAVDGKEYEKVISAKVPKEFKINTGNIYSVQEREFLATILKAKRIWVQIGDSRTEVVNATRNVETFKTRDFTPDLDLKFKTAVV